MSGQIGSLVELRDCLVNFAQSLSIPQDFRVPLPRF
jgi:hypothetical protein